MVSADSLAANWRSGGALVVCRHDPASTGLWASAVVPKDKLLPMARDLLSQGFMVLDLSTVETKEGFLLTWHFECLENPIRVALRVLVTREIPRCPSLYPVYQGAEWHERESCDFFGVSFIGNPNMVPLLLADDFEGPPPLLKEPGALASMASLGFFGTPEVLDPAWGPLVGGNEASSPASEGGGE
ncbi:MAG: NADH-quinone oxidoreductase subunit C [Deltaproteobacteria bacterium]|jgi:NADH-quinone oxidoreductase subunit C|nr:NADH-quinone oxidoreductase subunit C [Deltaproteobacteria bacterium]